MLGPLARNVAIVLLTPPFPAQRILEIRHHGLQRIQPGCGPPRNPSSTSWGPALQLLARPPRQGHPAHDAASFAREELQLIHAVAGVGFEGGEGFVIVEVNSSVPRSCPPLSPYSFVQVLGWAASAHEPFSWRSVSRP